MPSPQNIYNISIPFKRKSLLYYPFWGRQRCSGRKSWLLKSLIFQPTCPVCPKDHTSQSLPRPFKRIISHAKEHVVVFRCVSGTVCKTVKGNVGVWNIICRRVGLQANELHKTSFRPFSVHNVEKFKLKEIFTEINFLTLPRISKWALRNDSLWNRRALFALRGGPVNEERCKKWITGRGELRARAAHARLALQQQHHQQHAGRDSTSLSSASSLMSSLSPFSRLWCHSRPPTMILHFIGEVPSSKSIHGSVNLFGFQ